MSCMSECVYIFTDKQDDKSLRPDHERVIVGRHYTNNNKYLPLEVRNKLLHVRYDRGY